MTGKRKCWSKSIGERGRRVRIYEKRPGGPLLRSIWLHGKEHKKTLGHRDRELATRQAYELMHDMVTDEDYASGMVTLGTLEKLYLESPQHLAKKPLTQKSDERSLKRVVAYLGPKRNVLSLSESDVQRFWQARRRGDKSLERITPDRAVSDGTVLADMVSLLTALNWALRERKSDGRRLLKENPLFGVRLPKEKNPRRPVIRHDSYLKLLEVAGHLEPLLELALIVAEGTGRRISSWRNLRWDDVDFQAGTIRWRAVYDKKGYEQVVVMSDVVKEALKNARKRQAAIGTAPVFPAPKDPNKPCDRHVLDNWLRRAFPKAGVVQERGGLWHALRRKWATERKGYPVKDVAAAGGWRDTDTILLSYQHADPETTKQVVLHPTHRLVASS